MPVASKHSIEVYTGIDADHADKLMPRAPKAERKVKSATGSDLYDEVKAKGTGDDSYNLLQEAESLYTVYYGLSFSNMQMEANGSLTRVLGWNESRRQNMSHGELQAYKSRIWSQADEAIDALLEAEDETREDGEAIWTA